MESNRFYFSPKIISFITWKANCTSVFIRPSLTSLSKHIRTHPLLMSHFTFPSLQKINHRSQLMSPIMASCDCPFIIPLIISIIIIIISLLQFITLCPKEDSIMFWIAFFFVLFFFHILLQMAKFTCCFCNYTFSKKNCICKLHLKWESAGGKLGLKQV